MPKKLTTDQFKVKVFKFVGNEYEVIGGYLGSTERVIMKHNICNYEWPVFPNNFCKNNGTRCPKCQRLKQRKNTEQFTIDLKKVWGNKFTVLGTYGKNNKEPVEIRDNECNTVFKGIPNYLLSGCNGCPNCKKKKLSTKEFKKRLVEKRGNEFEVLGEYYTLHTPILIRHNVEGCMHEWRPRPSDIIHKGTGCPNCAGNAPLTQEQFMERVKEVHGNEYEIKTKYINMSTNIDVEHKPCGKSYSVNPNCFVNRKDGCRKCKGFEKSHEEFVGEIHKIFGKEFTVLSEYRGNKKKVKLKHEICGNVWKGKPNSFLSSKCGRCPKCRTSQGNKAIYNYLTKCKICFKPEYRDSNCRNIRPLPFDFAIFRNQKDMRNNKVLFLIEFQGRHHYEPVKAHGGLKGHLKCKRNDKIKVAYCKKYSIALETIHYSNLKTIEEYLEWKLKMYFKQKAYLRKEMIDMNNEDIKEVGYILAEDIDNETAYTIDLQYEER